MTWLDHSEMVSKHEIGLLLDEQMTDAEEQDLKEAEVICRNFLSWNLTEDPDGIDVRERLAEILGQEAED